MEIKIVFEIEKESRKTIDKFSEVIGNLGEIDKVIQKVVKSKEESNKVESGKDVQVESTQVKDEIENSENIETYETVELPNEETVPKTVTPAYTNEQLVEFCSQASQLGLGSKVKEIIRNGFGVQKVSDLASNVREDFVNKLRELGVRV